MIEAREFRNPDDLARHLSKYVTCPSTIVAGTANHFGKHRAIPFEKAVQLVQRRRKERERAKAAAQHKDKSSTKHDGAPYNPLTNKPLVFEKLPPARTQVQPVHNAPKAGGIWPGWFEPEMPRKLPRDLVASVGKGLGFSYAEMIGSNRAGALVAARAVVAVILRERGLSYPAVGRHLGGRDHSTIINLLKNWEHYKKRYPAAVAAYRANRDTPSAL